MSSLNVQTSTIGTTALIGACIPSTEDAGAKSLSINNYDAYGNVSVDYAINADTTQKNISVKLDTTTKAQLTPKFIKSNSTSAWSKLNLELEKHYLVGTNSDHVYSDDVVNFVKSVGDLFCEGLQTDLELMQNGGKVSDCALFAPRVRSTFNRIDRPIRLVYYIVEKMFVETGKASCLENGIVSYSKVIGKLSKQYVDEYTHDFLLNNKFKLFRILEHDRNNWLALKERGLNKVITEPSAMPVEVSPLSELEEFFSYLKSNQPITVNNHLNTKTARLEPCMMFNRGALYEDKRMDLCKQVVGPTWIGNLMNSLKHSEQVEHFLLGNNIIGPVGGKAIKDFLQSEHKPHIKTWYLAGNDLNSEAISDVVDGLLSDTDCEELWLKRNPLKPEGIAHIARLFKTNNKIKVLDLHNTAVFDEGVKFLFEALKTNRCLDFLYLDANGITEVGASYIAEYFDHLVSNDLKGITSLWVDMNQLGNNGVKRICQSLKNYKYLERISFGSAGLTDECIDTIVECLSDHDKLLFLDLGMYKSTADMGLVTNNIGDQGAIKLCRLIRQTKSIKYMSIIMNGITETGLNAINDAIQENSSLIYFDYTQYGIEVNQQLQKSIKDKLKLNMSESDVKLRILKHGKSIRYIDSIYRNNMK
jgi:Ran GTPase-activating protein (RanGAP) involved in mRNA processing and transport